MRKAYQIDEAEYKLGLKKGAEALINKSMRPYVKNAEVNAIEGEYWLSYDFNEIKYKLYVTQGESSYLNGWSHTII